jgi:hypothetical protein
METKEKTTSLGILLVKIFSIILILVSLSIAFYVAYPYLLRLGLTQSSNSPDGSVFFSRILDIQYFFETVFNIHFQGNYYPVNTWHYIFTSLYALFLLICGLGSLFVKRWARFILICASAVFLFDNMPSIINLFLTRSDEQVFTILHQWFYYLTIPALIIIFYLIPVIKKTFDKQNEVFSIPIPVFLLATYFAYSFVFQVISLFNEPSFFLFGFMLVSKVAVIVGIVFSLIYGCLAVNLYRRSMMAWRGALLYNSLILLSCIFNAFILKYSYLGEKMGISSLKIDIMNDVYGGNVLNYEYIWICFSLILILFQISTLKYFRKQVG